LRNIDRVVRSVTEVFQQLQPLTHQEFGRGVRSICADPRLALFGVTQEDA
jgi:hypothetical protein